MPGLTVRVSIVVVSACACGWIPRAETEDASRENDEGEDTTASAESTDDADVSSSSTGARGSTNDDEDSSSGEAPSNPFIVPPDGGGVNIECDIWAQDCAEGEKCMPWANDGGNAWNATKCTPLAPDPKAPGEPCTVVESGVSGIDDCETSAMCWNVDPETLEGVCVGFCGGSEANPTCAMPNTTCAITCEGTLILCLASCDPLLQDCDENEECAPGVSESFRCVPDASGSSGAAGDPCEFLNVCDPGLFCANPEGVPNCAGSIGCCAAFCDLGDPNACPLAEVECVPWYEEGQALPGEEDVGACLIPS